MLIALVGWRSIFLVNLPIGAAGLWLAWRYAEETPRLAQREIDLPGQIAAITALGAPAGALIEGGRLGWSHPLVIVGFASAAVVGLLFVWREARAPQPMLPLSLFGHRMFALTALVGLLFNIAFYGVIFVLSLYFQNVRGWSPFATGLAFVPMMAMVLPKLILEWIRRMLAEHDALVQEIDCVNSRGHIGHIRLGVIPVATPMVSLLTTAFHRASVRYHFSSFNELSRG